MRIERSGGDIHIILSQAESRRLMVDHGEDELVIPLPEMEGEWDTMDALEAISEARR